MSEGCIQCVQIIVEHLKAGSCLALLISMLPGIVSAMYKVIIGIILKYFLFHILLGDYKRGGKIISSALSVMRKVLQVC